IELQIIALNWIYLRSNLFPTELVAPAVDCVKQTLGEIGARTEKLHLLSHEHGRNAARNRAIVAPRAAHERIALELQCARVDGDFRCELAKVIRQSRRIPNGEIRLRRRSKIVERVQEAKTGFRHQR